MKNCCLTKTHLLSFEKMLKFANLQLNKYPPCPEKEGLSKDFTKCVEIGIYLTVQLTERKFKEMRCPPS